MQDTRTAPLCSHRTYRHIQLVSFLTTWEVSDVRCGYVMNLDEWTEWQRKTQLVIVACLWFCFVLFRCHHIQTHWSETRRILYWVPVLLHVAKNCYWKTALEHRCWHWNVHNAGSWRCCSRRFLFLSDLNFQSKINRTCLICYLGRWMLRMTRVESLIGQNIKTFL